MSVFTDLLESSNDLYNPIGNPWATNATTTAGAITVKGTVVDAVTKKVIDRVNILVNGVSRTQTNSLGIFTLYNIMPSDVIETSHLSYGMFFQSAENFPKIVELEAGTNALKEVTVVNNYKKPTNWLLPLGIVAITFLAYRKYGKKATVKAKI